MITKTVELWEDDISLHGDWLSALKRGDNGRLHDRVLFSRQVDVRKRFPKDKDHPNNNTFTAVLDHGMNPG
jgi:hypothetical protein